MNIQGQSTAKNGLSLSKSGSAYGNEQSIGGGGHEHIYTGWSSTVAGNTAGQIQALGLTALFTAGGGEHTHTFTPSVSDNISFSLSGDTETRPDNYTYIIWKRIS